jgi:hypothetical protein
LGHGRELLASLTEYGRLKVLDEDSLR